MMNNKSIFVVNVENINYVSYDRTNQYTLVHHQNDCLNKMHRFCQILYTETKVIQLEQSRFNDAQGKVSRSSLASLKFLKKGYFI